MHLVRRSALQYSLGLNIAISALTTFQALACDDCVSAFPMEPTPNQLPSHLNNHAFCDLRSQGETLSCQEAPSEIEGRTCAEVSGDALVEGCPDCIRWRATVDLDPASVNEQSIQVWTELRGRIQGSIRLESDGRTLVFDPDETIVSGQTPWFTGDTVHVQTGCALRLVSGKQACPWQSTFQVATTGGSGSLTVTDTVINLPIAWPYDIVAAHMDSDGWIDLIAPDREGNGVVIAWNPRGPISPERSWGTTTLEADNKLDTRHVLPVDVDLDGDIDLVAGLMYQSNGTNNYQARLYLNRGNRQFEPLSLFYTAWAPRAMAAADLNGDGLIDLMIANEGRWKEDDVNENSCSDGIDNNHDGLMDNDDINCQYTATILLADGEGEHPYDEAIPMRFNIGLAPRWVEPVDLEGDGDLDLVVARMDECTDTERPCPLSGYDEEGTEVVAGELLLLRNDGLGHFSPWSTNQDNKPTPIEVPPINNEYKCVPQSLRAGDFDRDGRPEIVVFSHQCGAVCLWDPSSANTEWSCTEVAGPDQFFPAAVGDLNADGWLDTLVPDRTRGTAFLLQGDEGRTFAQDFSFFFVAYSPQGAVFADLDNDGDLDGAIAAVADNGVFILLENKRDGDGDCYLVPNDCDDTDPYTHPGQIEAQVPGLGVGIDNNCNGIIDEGTQWYDDDGDGYSELIGDCNDDAPDVYPGADEPPCTGEDEDCDGVSGLEEESLNGIDDDCDPAQIVDNGTEGWDDDGDGLSELEGDCNDADASIYPGADESSPGEQTGDGKDNDCDGNSDEGTTSIDDDGDGFSEEGGDCNDYDAAIFGTAPEVLDDQKDNNCDGAVDELSDASGCRTTPTTPRSAIWLALVPMLAMWARRSSFARKKYPSSTGWGFLFVVFGGGLLSHTCLAGSPPLPQTERTLAPRSTYLAIVIGINTYEDPAWEPLAHAESDANAVAAVLEDPALGGFDQVLRLSGQGATRARIKQTLQSIRTLPQDVVVVYFAGHAIRARDRYGYWHQYLIPWDGSQRLIDETSIRFEWLADEIEHFRAQGRVVIADACNNIYEPDRPHLKGLRGQADDWVNLRYSIYLRSAGEGMRAREDDRLNHGVYTHYLLEALRQPQGRSDKDHDGAVSAYEAHIFAAAQTRRFTQEQQVPMVSEVEAGAPEVILSGRRTQRNPTFAVITDTVAMGRSRGSMLRAVPSRGGPVQEGPLEEGLALQPGQYDIELRSAEGSLLRRGRSRVYAGVNRLEHLFMPPTLQPILLTIAPTLRFTQPLFDSVLLPMLAKGLEVSISGGIRRNWGLVLGMGYVYGPIPPYPDSTSTWATAALLHHAGANRTSIVIGPRVQAGLTLKGSRTGATGPTFLLAAGGQLGAWFRFHPHFFLGASVDADISVLREWSGTSAPQLQVTPQLKLAYGL